MSDPRIEDHAVGVELQLTELVEERERALVQGRTDRAEELTKEIEALQSELAATAELLTGEHFDAADIAGEGIAGEGIAGEGIAGEGIAGEGIAGEGIAGEGIAGEGTAEEAGR